MQRSTNKTAHLLRQREAIVRFGRLALQSDDLAHVLDEACRLTAEALATKLSKILELQDGGRSLLVVAGVGWRDGIVGEERVPAIAQSSEGYALTTGVPAVSDDIQNEERFDYADFLRQHGVKAMVNVVIPGPPGRAPYGLLQVDSTKPRDFSKNDIEFMQSYANLIGAAIERQRFQAELAEAVRTQERLMVELQHRVANNLTIITSLLQLKARRAHHPVVAQELSEVLGRVDVLREVYKQLYSSSSVSEVNLGGYLTALVSNLIQFACGAGREVRLETKFEPVPIEPDAAVTLGLVTNEFVTNSIKHAAGHDALTISISLAVEGGDLSLALADDGNGLGDALQRKERQGSGSGLMLIEGLLRQLKGEWDWVSDRGTTLRVKVPLSKILVQPNGV